MLPRLPHVEPIVAVRGLHVVRGGNEILHDVSMQLLPGSVTAFLGPNGAGKTSTMLAVLGLLPVAAGEIRILDKAPEHLTAAERAAIGFLPQDNGIMPGARPFEWLLHMARLRGLGRDEALAVAERLGVRDVRRPVRTLSIGERRRVGAASALLGRPRLVILDEATMGLDPELRDRVLLEITRVAATGSAVLFSTHLLDEVHRLADHVIVLRAGRVVAQDELRAARGTAERELEIQRLIGDVYRSGT